MDSSYYQEYAATEDKHWWFAARRDILRKILRKWLPPDPARRILDVGCGTGAMLELLREFGKAEGLDSSENAINHCRQRLGLDIELHEGDIPGKLPPGRSYDVVTAFDVIEHIADPLAALRQVRQLLTPSGLFICTVPAFQFLWGPHDEINHHYRRYARADLVAELKQSGFRVHWTSYFNTLLFLPIALYRLWNKATIGDKPPKSDLSAAPACINRLLRSILSAERVVLPTCSLPFGVSLVAIAQTTKQKI